MSLKKRGLGRGLEALLVNVDTKDDKQLLQTLPTNALQQNADLPASALDADELQELAYSIIASDSVDPIVVRRLADSHFEILEGENRWQAAQLAGLQEIPVIIKELDDREAIALALLETVQQENLILLQEAETLRALIDEFEAMVRQL
ncbi:MAG: ParB/RepB/Spo0J family partition protein [Methylococcales bacterium]|nr:ParB/RepB/Spo0J family partition protein [Methylococcales bacterium]